MRKNNNPYYVSNKQLFAAMVEYKNQLAEAQQRDKQPPRLPEYVGQCIMLIAQKLATKGNFCDYSYKDEMISDGIENCVKYINNFNPEKSNNPFAYITQIIKNSFIRRIQSEKRQQAIKYKNMIDTIPEWDQIVPDHQFNEVAYNVISAFETTLTNKKNKAKKDKQLAAAEQLPLQD